jgi:hypothetical protein
MGKEQMVAARRSRTRTTRTKARRARASTRSRSRQPDAIAMLRADHERVSEAFARFERLTGHERKEKLVEQICADLDVHTQLEEELFYPAVRAAIRDDDLMDEAVVEHQSAKELIAQLRAMKPDDDLYDAKVTVLGEYVKHHVKEEQGEMFPKARRSGVDLRDLGEQMRERRAELTKGGPLEVVRRMLR